MLLQAANFAQTYYYTTDTSTDTSTSPALIITAVIFAVIMIAAMWKIFTKAKQPGWAAIIPIYNTIVLLKVVNRPIWWVILFFIPFVNLIMSFVVYYDLALAFGKGVGYMLLLIFLPIIGFPMLAWGDARYTMPKRP